MQVLRHARLVDLESPLPTATRLWVRSVVGLACCTLFGLVPSVVAPSANAQEVDQAQRDFDFMQVQFLNRSKIHRNDVVKGYGDFIARYPDHPLTAGAKLGLAGIYLEELAGTSYIPDPGKAKEIFREVRESEPKGSEDWRTATVRLAGMADTPPREAIELLEDVIDEAQPNETIAFESQARIFELTLFHLNDVETAVDIAEDFAKALFDPARTPTDPFDRTNFHLTLSSKVRVAIGVIVQWHQPKAQREAMLDRLDAANQSSEISTALERAREQLARLPEYRPVADSNRHSLALWGAMGGSVAAVAALYYIARRSRR